MRPSNDPEVEQALRAVAAGSVEDYRIVVAAYHRRLNLWLAAFCPPGVDSEEITHLAFLEAYRRIGRYQLGTGFFAWLCAFARNLVRAECEKIQRLARNKENYLQESVAAEQLLANDHPSPFHEQRGQFLVECLEHLHGEARQLLDWRYGEGERVQGIAERLGRSASAVSVQLFGLRKILRECVSRKMGELENAPTASIHGTP